jgi:hypothetical protein
MMIKMATAFKFGLTGPFTRGAGQIIKWTEEVVSLARKEMYTTETGTTAKHRDMAPSKKLMDFNMKVSGLRTGHMVEVKKPGLKKLFMKASTYTVKNMG